MIKAGKYQKIYSDMNIAKVETYYPKFQFNSFSTEIFSLEVSINLC